LGSSAFASPRLFRGVTLSLVVVVAAFVGAGKDDRTRLPDCWPASAAATVIDFRSGILEGDGGGGRGTVVGLIELRRRLGGILPKYGVVHE
jgi:hypothetical protein